jgi:hypothetical protein
MSGVDSATYAMGTGVKVKEKLFLSLIKQHTMKTYGEEELLLNIFPASVLKKLNCQLHMMSSVPPGTPVSPRAALDDVEKTKSPAMNQTDTNVVQPMA